MLSDELFKLNFEISMIRSLKNQGLIDEREYLEAERELKKIYDLKNRKTPA